MASSGFDPFLAAGGGMLGAGIGNMLSGWKNPADKAMNYMDRIPGQLEKYLGPYSQAGQRQIPGLESEYGRLLGDPGGMVNRIGAGYQQSPGFQFALQQALQGAGHAAAAGGMAGSPQHEQQNMGLATNLANQDYMGWLEKALGLYGMGMQGKQNIFNTGAQTSMGLGEDLSSTLANQAKLAYEGQNAKNQHSGGGWGSAIGGAASLAAGALPFIFSSKVIKDYDSTPNTTEILDNVRHLSLDKWRYKGIDQKFLGPYAEEFTERFGVGDGKTINMIDAIGVLLGAIKELDKKVAYLEETKRANTIS